MLVFSIPLKAGLSKFPGKNMGGIGRERPLKNFPMGSMVFSVKTSWGFHGALGEAGGLVLACDLTCQFR